MTAVEIEYLRVCDPLERTEAGLSALLTGARSRFGAARTGGEADSNHDVDELVDIVHDRL